jgi:Rod binding domain-containing protein
VSALGSDISIPATGLPPIDPSQEPSSIRNGGPKAQKAYQVALSFEQVLVDQLTQELAATATSTDGDSSDSGQDSSGSTGASGLMGSDPASSAYANLLPQALTTSLMSGGGLGIAQQLAQAIDPAIGHPAPATDQAGGGKP